MFDSLAPQADAEPRHDEHHRAARHEDEHDLEEQEEPAEGAERAPGRVVVRVEA